MHLAGFSKNNLFLLTPFKAFLAIAALCLVVYFPSFFHVARGDQVSYLADMAARDDHSWVRMAFKDYNFNRVRQFDRGDEHLFRPAGFFLMGTETYLFGYDFKLWQATSLFFHLVLLWWLLKVAWLIRPGYFAAGCVAVFSVMTAHMEMVIWHNIISYLIFLIFLVMVVFYLMLYQRESRLRYLGICILALGCSMLMNELAFPFMFYITVAAVFSRMNRWHLGILLGSLALMMIGFFTWDVIDFLATRSQLAAVTDVAHKAALGQTLKNTCTAMGWWFYTGILPYKAGLREVSRMMAMGIYEPWGAACGMLVAGILAMMIAALWFCYRRTGMFLGKHRKLMLLLVLMILSVAGVLAFGRMNVQDPRQALSVATYYGYFFWIFMVLLIVAFVDNIFPVGKIHRVWQGVAGIILGMMLVTNAWGTFKKNLEYADNSRDVISLTQAVENFIRQHAKEKDFSFFIPTQWPNYEVSWMVKVSERGRRFSFVEALFPKYFRQDNPKYTLHFGRP
ncbi:MAG: hypothetical protein V2A70_01435 [Candidatus Omnitrophota bacterium]